MFSVQETFPVHLLIIDIQGRSAANGVSNDLYCVYREQIARRNRRWSEWRHNGARSSKRPSSGFCLGLFRQRTFDLDAKLLQAEPLFKNSHWNDIALGMATEHSTALCCSSGIKSRIALSIILGTGTFFFFRCAIPVVCLNCKVR